MPKVEFINKSKKSNCRVCGGTGFDSDKEVNLTKCETCKVCKGKGYRIVDNYILVATDNKGQKIAFSTDGIK